jgi:hypothetical protein
MSPSSEPSARLELPPPPASVLSKNPLSWLALLGPGAIVASLTIGTGELIFSARAGSLFGSDILWFFLLTLVLKWALVFASARHMCISGAHPMGRYMQLPGPRGWFPLVLAIFLVLTTPVWGGFLAHTTGTLLHVVLGEKIGGLFAHAYYGPYVWGGLVFCLGVSMTFLGGYQALEKVQLFCVGIMMLCALIALVLLNPDYFDLLRGLFVPTNIEYPPWFVDKFATGTATYDAPFVEAYKAAEPRPIWIETSTYVGVLGGSGFDYLLYVACLREKQWGFASRDRLTKGELESLAPEIQNNIRGWLRAPLVDSLMSFAIVLFFSVVFVACGVLVLAPEHKLPVGNDLLTNQAEFFGQVHAWFVPVYLVGAVLTLAGSVYGSLEVSPLILGEVERAFFGERTSDERRKRVRRAALFWNIILGTLVIVGSMKYALTPIEVIKPINLFTGVLLCGLIALLNPWLDWKFLPRSLRMPKLLLALNVIAGLFMIALGLKSYWDYGTFKSAEYGGFVALGVLGGTLAFGWIAGYVFNKTRDPGS